MIAEDIAAYVRSAHYENIRSANAVYAYKLAFCTVVDSGVILTRDNYVISETVHGIPNLALKEQYQNKLDSAVGNSHSTRESPLILVSKIGYKNYGHWLVEMLPKVYLAESFFNGKAKYALIELDGGMKEVVLTTLKMLGVNENRVIFFHTPACFTNLIYISPVSHHPIKTHPFIAEFFRGFKSRLMVGKKYANLVKNKVDEKIFVIRGRGSNRQLENESVIAEFLSSRGFRIVSPGDLTLLEQVVLFGSAKVVVGVSGAGMTNIVFCKPQTNVIFLVPSSMPNLFFHNLANAFLLNYIECRSTESKSMYADFNIDLEHFSSLFETLL